MISRLSLQGAALVQLIPISVSLGCLWSLVAMDNMDGRCARTLPFLPLHLCAVHIV